MVENLKQKTVSAVLWNTVEKILVKGSSFIIGIILARLLLPSDYGLLGMLAIFISLSNVFIESGFAKALIQKQDCSDVDYSTAFFTNVCIAITIYLILFFCAPLVANFYEEPILINVLRVLSINFVLGSFNVVQRAKLMSSMNFKALAKINFIGVLAGGLCGILMAYSDYGVWALVGQAITSTLAMLFLFPFFSKWKPKLIFSVESFKRLFNFGSKLLVTGTAATIVNNITTIAIGKAYKSDQLGYYTRASQFSEIVAWTINDIMGTVTFPVLSKLQEERERLILVYRKSLLYTAVVIFPVMTLMAILAEPLVKTLLTDKWLPCVPLLQILCFARMFTPLSAINMNVLNAIGRPDLFMKVDLSKMPLILISLAITLPLGVKAVVIGNLVTTVICFFINAYMPGKLLGYGAWEQIKDYKYIFIALLVMIVAVFVVANMLNNSILQLIVGGVLGLVIYAVLVVILKVISVEEIKSLIKR